jgi:TPP-dependent pyruvate/acetoin dehydrogenase alpha subunit
MNFAAIQNLPVIFFIENNCYTERSSVDKIHNISDLAERAKGYGFPGLIVDGNNAVEIYGAMKKALEYATTAKQPVLIESKTYRLAGHTLDDDQTYRSYEEVKEWLDYDPIDNMADYMIENKIGIQDDLLMIREKIEEELNNEIDFLITSQDENKSENLTVAGDFSTES